MSICLHIRGSYNHNLTVLREVSQQVVLGIRRVEWVVLVVSAPYGASQKQDQIKGARDRVSPIGHPSHGGRSAEIMISPVWIRAGMPELRVWIDNRQVEPEAHPRVQVTEYTLQHWWDTWIIWIHTDSENPEAGHQWVTLISAVYKFLLGGPPWIRIVAEHVKAQDIPPHTHLSLIVVLSHHYVILPHVRMLSGTTTELCRS